tara:strand:- start:12046 stop:12948 length:903 start_codon:yes stop_codon:yes gene_type:complete
MFEKKYICPLCNSDHKGKAYYNYGNRKNLNQKKFFYLIYFIIYFFIPKFVYLKFRVPRRIMHSIWYRKRIYKCFNCELSFLSSLPSKKNLLIWYNSSGNTTKKDISTDEEKFSKRTFSQINYLESILDLNSINKSLEYGAGNGEISQILKKKYNIETTTVDISSESNKFLKKTGLIDHVEESFPNVESYDLIICSHVLHLIDDFPDILKKIEYSLKKNGYFFIETPNISEEYFKIDGQDAPYIWFLNQNVIKYISTRRIKNIRDISFFGPKWRDFINLGIKNDDPSQTDDSIIIRSVLSK